MITSLEPIAELREIRVFGLLRLLNVERGIHFEAML